MFNWIKALFSRRSAFAIGSRVYGEPRQDSDLDLVIYCDEETAKLLYYRGKCKSRDSETGSYSLQFGDLNLIVCTKPIVYQCWLNGFKECMRLFNRTGRKLTRSMAEGIF